VKKSSILRTYTGRRFHHARPRTHEICIEDVAHALSLICRYTGHVAVMYSVAEHCVRVSMLFKDPTLALWGLMHDASEAYFSDMHRYLKRLPEMEQYRKLENRCMGVVAKKFKLDPCRAKEPVEVQIADRRLALTEMRDLKRKQKYKDCIIDGVLITPLRGTIKPWSSKKAERLFLQRYSQLLALRRARH
jgi:uncharacterized protein